MTSKFLTVIPARAGSSGVPGKNTMVIAGQTLVGRALAHSRRYSHLGPVVLSTNIEDLLLEEVPRAATIPPPNEVIQAKDFFVHHRSAQDATAEAPIVDTLQFLVETMSAEFEFDAVLLLQPTSPFRCKNDASQISIRLPKINKDSSIVSFANVGEMHPARMYQTKGLTYGNIDGFQEFRQTRRQDLPPVYIRDGAFYVIGTNLIKQGLQFSQNPEGFVRDAPWTTNIDTAADVAIALAAAATIRGDDK